MHTNTNDTSVRLHYLIYFLLNSNCRPLFVRNIKIGGTKTKRQFTLGSFHKPLLHDTKRDLQNAVVVVAFIHNCFADKFLF